jgi:hypothetical protein
VGARLDNIEQNGALQGAANQPPPPPPIHAAAAWRPAGCWFRTLLLRDEQL